MSTVLYSILHFLVDGVCAWAMFGRFVAGPGGYAGILVYNFCAFALQLPFGVIADRINGRRTPAVFAGLGAILTLAGAMTHPAVLGVGNALFHVGGGVGTIREDWHRGWKGRALGVFVAPGALGLFLGGQMAQKGLTGPLLLPVTALVLAPLLLGLSRCGGPVTVPQPASGCGWLAAVGCFAVVVLRSHVGMAVSFSWKNGFWLSLAATLAVVLGKTGGGLLAARFGRKRVTVASLLLAALGFGLGELPVWGLLALFCFNMTMPLTLYALVRRFPEYPGAAFGLLTFGLFLGFLPTYYRWDIPGNGVVGSLISLSLLGMVGKAVTDHGDLRNLTGADPGH